MPKGSLTIDRFRSYHCKRKSPTAEAAFADLSKFSQDERKEINPNQTECRIGWLLQLRRIVSVLPELASALNSSEISSSLLQVLADKVADST